MPPQMKKEPFMLIASSESFNLAVTQSGKVYGFGVIQSSGKKDQVFF